MGVTNKKSIKSLQKEDLIQLQEKFYRIVDACESEDSEYRYKSASVRLMTATCSINLEDDCGATEEDEDFEREEAHREISIDFELETPDEFESLSEDEKPVFLLVEYIAQDSNPKKSVMEKLKANNFFKAFTKKTKIPVEYFICSRQGDERESDKYFDRFVDYADDIATSFVPDLNVYEGNDVTTFRGDHLSFTDPWTQRDYDSNDN